VAILVVACTSDDRNPGELATGCAINSDCREPLVCAFRKCHSACVATRDCPAGTRCVASDRPFHVCQLGSERTCTYHSDCPEGQVCGIDGQCRDQCKATPDCLAEQVCVAGTCAEQAELRDGGLTAVSKDASPPTGQSCAYNSQCPGRLVCRDGSCRLECLSSIDCKSGRECVENRCQVPLCPEADAGSGMACAFNSECAAPLVCKSGICTCECRLAGDCPSGYDCVSSRCVPSNIDSIGPEGGLLVSPDRRLTLEVPPGALTTRVHLTMEFASAWPKGALGPVFEVRPTGTTFAAPATFVYRYDLADLAPFGPAGVRLAVATGASWTRLTSVVDTTAGTISAQTTHLSTYGLVAPETTDASVDAGPVDAGRCVGAVCSGTIADTCCPTGCTALTDVDCTGCGNGRIEAGETCDPPGSCPTCDDQNDCTTDSQTGSAATCDVRCQNAPKACSNAGKDKCCPLGCSAQNDSDCAGCGDGMIDPTAGETCDPPSNCPTGCAPGACWEVKTLTGSPSTCNVRCSTTQLPCSGTTSDGCCPPGCNTSPANRDVDCPAQCGNGIVDVGETCDPLSSCPMTCPQMGCTLRSLAGGGTCQAQCQTSGTQTSCANNDACCPTGCNAVNDNNCSAVCGNGVLEPGELCEGTMCPTSCPNQGCTIRALQGTGCQRQCVDAGTIACGTNNDSCCPAGCTAMTDTDCSGCGNGRIEAGETCDPPGTCPNCNDSDSCTTDTQTGSASTCNVVCSHAPKTCSNAGKDQCCPTGCSAGNDSDCAGCGDGVIDMTSGETCDPPSTCPSPTSCTPAQCWDIATYTGSAMTCNATCTHSQRACSGTTKDGCCPPGCNTSLANRDDDCPAQCGNGFVETGETCDPLSTCVMTCPQINCQLRTLANGGTCQAACVNNGMQTACTNGDQCCPGGGSGTCNSLNDNDCLPFCGNSVIESGEICDGNCPSSCSNMGCTVYSLQGTGCQRQCVATGTISTCTNGDGCCASGCNANNDNNCTAVCGNGIVESGELCETSGDGGTPTGPDGGAGTICPSSCPPIGCQLRVVQGTGCQRQCVNATGGDGGTGMITGCISNDGCCPSGCNATNDNNCSPVCGNNVTEPPETCDGNCPTATSCFSDADFVRTFNPGSAAGCDETCTSVPRACDPNKADGFCPSMCDSSTDLDCPPKNDQCKNALDISTGGTFTVDIPAPTKQDTAEACGAKGPEVFYMFDLTTPEFVFLSALDNPVTGNVVPVTIEVYADDCPPPDGAGRVIACDDGKAGETACRRNPFPLVTTSGAGVLAGKPLNQGKYFVAVRAWGGAGSWTLTFDHVPTACFSNQPVTELVPLFGQLAFSQGNTCGHLDEIQQSCGASKLEDDSYAIYRCPNALQVTTCDGRTVIDTTLNAFQGSLTSGNGQCVPGSGKEIGCSKDVGVNGCDINPTSSALSFNDTTPGIVTVNVEGLNKQTGGPCGGFSIGTNYSAVAGRP
jgi:hypothetical protein